MLNEYGTYPFFETYGRSLSTFFRLFVAQGWTSIVYAASDATTEAARVFFISFQIIVSLLLTNIVVGVIVNMFTEVRRLNSELLFSCLANFTGTAHVDERGAIESDVLKLNTLLLPLHEVLEASGSKTKSSALKPFFQELRDRDNFTQMSSVASVVRPRSRGTSHVNGLREQDSFEDFVNTHARLVDVDQLLLKHPWVLKVGYQYIQQHATAATRVDEAQEEAAAAEDQANTQWLEAEAAEARTVRAKAALETARNTGDAATMLSAEDELNEAVASSETKQGEAQLAQAKAAVMQAKLQVEKEEGEAELEQQQARTARNAAVRAEGAPSDDDTETWGSTTDDDIETWAESPDLPRPLTCEDVPAALCETENRIMAQRERDELLLAEAEVALARSQLEAEETAAAALKEKLELASAKQQVAAAELALEAAQEQNDSALMEKAKHDVLLAKAVAENEEREALMAGAIAAVEAAELRAEQAAFQVVVENADVQVADDLVRKREQELSIAKMQGKTAATERALHALNDAQAAAAKERSDAQAAAIVALDTTKQTEEEIQAAESKMEEIELRAAVNAELSTKAEKHVVWFSTGAALLLISTVFLISFGTSSIIYMLANRVIDNDKLLVTSAQQECTPVDSF